MDMSRRKIAALVIGLMVATSSLGWFAGSRTRSPGEIAARTAAPQPSPILVAAEERVLSADVVTRGTGRFGSPRQLTTARSALKPDAGIVTSIPVVGAELAEGSVVANASGRPVLLVQGDRVGTRDLGPGLQGEDVRELEGALARLGKNPGPVDGVYDSGTEAAVTRWYESVGFAPFRATEDQLASIRTREAELAKARVEFYAADDKLATAGAELAAKRAASTNARAARAQGPGAIAAARIKADAANRAGAAEVAAKLAALDELMLNPPPDRPTRPAIAAAEADLAMARANADSTRVDGERAVGEAEAAAAVAATDVAPADAALQAARQSLDSSKGALRDQGRAVDLAALEADLGRRRAGVQVPADEVVFVPSAPVRVKELAVKLGEPLSGPVMTVTDAVVAIDGSLTLEDSPLVKSGMNVQIGEADLGIEARGVVSHVAEAPGTNGVDGFHSYFEVLVNESPPKLVGASVVVPISAVSLAADGSSQITRSVNGAMQLARVKAGLSADGYVEVTVLDGALRPGDLVVVGVDSSKRGANG